MQCPKCNARIGFFRTFGTSFPRSVKCPSCKSVLEVKRVQLAFAIALAICAILDVFLGLLSWRWTVITIALSNLVAFYAVFTRLIELLPSET